jgi:WD40 repeat protein
VTRVVADAERDVVLAAAGTCVRAWGWRDGRPRRPLRHGGDVHDVALAPAGRLVATACEDNDVWLFELDGSGPPRRLGGHESAVLAVAWQAGSAQLASGSIDRSAVVWSLADGAPASRLRAHARAVRRVAWAPDGATLVTAADDGSARLWCTGPRPGLATLRHYERMVMNVRFAPNGREVTTVTRAPCVHVWNVATGALVRTLAAPAPVTDAAHAPAGGLVAVACADRTVRLHDAATGALVRALALPEPEEGPAGLPDDPDVTFSPDGRLLLVSSRTGPGAVFAADGGQQLYALPAAPRFYSTGNVARAAFDAHGRWLAVVRPDGRQNVVAVHRAGDGALLATIERHTAFVESVAFDAQGERLLTAAADQLACVFAWDGARARELVALRGHADCVLEAGFSPDGRQVVTAGMDGTARVWDAASGACRHVLAGHDGLLYSARFDRTGDRILTASWDETAIVWDARTGERLLRHASHDRALLCADWSPDGTLVVTGATDGTARIWPSDPLAYARAR